MVFKRFVSAIFVALICTVSLSLVSFAEDQPLPKPVYSTVKTSFKLTRNVKCDGVKALFVVYAEGDNYSMALKRLKSLNNRFVKFLNTLFSAKDIQTVSPFQYSNRASLSITLNTGNISGISKVLGYISAQNFPYKSGIRVEFIRYVVSDELRSRVKGELFKEALNKARERLLTINEILGGGYEIKTLSIGEPAIRMLGKPFDLMFRKAPLSKGASKSGIETSPGSVKITTQVEMEAIRRITQ